MTPQAVLAALSKAAWDWDLNHFASALGKRPDDVWVREQFLILQKAGEAARNLSTQVVAAIFPSSP